MVRPRAAVALRRRGSRVALLRGHRSRPAPDTRSDEAARAAWDGLAAARHARRARQAGQDEKRKRMREGASALCHQLAPRLNALMLASQRARRRLGGAGA